MDAVVLLANLRALLERTPDFSTYSGTSREHQIWLAQAYALVLRWNNIDAIGLKSSTDMLGISLMFDSSVARIISTLHRAIADLELQIPPEAQTAFDAHSPYDFFRQLNSLIKTAEAEIFVVDPYLDHTVFDNYLSSRPDNVSARLLLNKNAESVGPAAKLYVEQHGPILEVRKSTAIHDRVVFIDRFACWVIGHSIKDAAKAKPTYIAPLPPDVVAIKLKSYEGIWESASAI
jgi:hypothetical protein